MKWVNILHLYQPPTQTKEVVDLVVHESYKKILDLLDQYPDLRLTINIAGSLLELLKKYGHEEIIAGYRRHAERGAVELLASAMYHPILPLLNPKEMLRQIDLHERISKNYFGEAYHPTGFYLPEMAYSNETGKVLATLAEERGFRWIVLDEIHTTTPIDPKLPYIISGLKLGVIFRNTLFSKSFPPEKIVESMKSANAPLKEDYLITCHDGELYGHWHKDDRGYYEKAFTSPDIIPITASEYLAEIKTLAAKRHEHEQEINVRDASWESTPAELEQGISFGLWNSKDNEIHKLLEEFKCLALTTVEENQADPGYDTARHHADRGIASCAWWWASERKLGPFSPITWNPTEINKGLTELYRAVYSLEKLPKDQLIYIEALAKKLKNLIWQKHREQYDPEYPFYI